MSSSVILNDCFPIQNLTMKKDEIQNELQRLNALLFNKIETLKKKIIQLETQLEKRHKDNKDNFDDFEIIDLATINEFNMDLYNV